MNSQAFESEKLVSSSPNSPSNKVSVTTTDESHLPHTVDMASPASSITDFTYATFLHERDSDDFDDNNQTEQLQYLGDDVKNEYNIEAISSHSSNEQNKEDEVISSQQPYIDENYDESKTNSINMQSASTVETSTVEQELAKIYIQNNILRYHNYTTTYRSGLLQFYIPMTSTSTPPTTTTGNNTNTINTSRNEFNTDNHTMQNYEQKDLISGFEEVNDIENDLIDNGTWVTKWCVLSNKHLFVFNESPQIEYLQQFYKTLSLNVIESDTDMKTRAITTTDNKTNIQTSTETSIEMNTNSQSIITTIDLKKKKKEEKIQLVSYFLNPDNEDQIMQVIYQKIFQPEIVIPIENRPCGISFHQSRRHVFYLPSMIDPLSLFTMNGKSHTLKKAQSLQSQSQSQSRSQITPHGVTNQQSFGIFVSAPTKSILYHWLWCINAESEILPPSPSYPLFIESFIFKSKKMAKNRQVGVIDDNSNRDDMENDNDDDDNARVTKHPFWSEFGLTSLVVGNDADLDNRNVNKDDNDEDSIDDSDDDQNDIIDNSNNTLSKDMNEAVTNTIPSSRHSKQSRVQAECTEIETGFDIQGFENLLQRALLEDQALREKEQAEKEEREQEANISFLRRKNENVELFGLNDAILETEVIQNHKDQKLYSHSQTQGDKNTSLIENNNIRGNNSTNKLCMSRQEQKLARFAHQSQSQSQSYPQTGTMKNVSQYFHEPIIIDSLSRAKVILDMFLRTIPTIYTQESELYETQNMLHFDINSKLEERQQLDTTLQDLSLAETILSSYQSQRIAIIDQIEVLVTITLRSISMLLSANGLRIKKNEDSYNGTGNGYGNGTGGGGGCSANSNNGNGNTIHNANVGANAIQTSVYGHGFDYESLENITYNNDLDKKSKTSVLSTDESLHRILTSVDSIKNMFQYHNTLSIPINGKKPTIEGNYIAKATQLIMNDGLYNRKKQPKEVQDMLTTSTSAAATATAMTTAISESEGDDGFIRISELSLPRSVVPVLNPQTNTNSSLYSTSTSSYSDRERGNSMYDEYSSSVDDTQGQTMLDSYNDMIGYDPNNSNYSTADNSTMTTISDSHPSTISDISNISSSKFNTIYDTFTIYCKDVNNNDYNDNTYYSNTNSHLNGGGKSDLSARQLYDNYQAHRQHERYKSGIDSALKLFTQFPPSHLEQSLQSACQRCQHDLQQTLETAQIRKMEQIEKMKRAKHMNINGKYDSRVDRIHGETSRDGEYKSERKNNHNSHTHTHDHDFSTSSTNNNVNSTNSTSAPSSAWSLTALARSAAISILSMESSSHSTSSQLTTPPMMKDMILNAKSYILQSKIIHTPPSNAIYPGVTPLGVSISEADQLLENVKLTVRVQKRMGGVVGSNSGVNNNSSSSEEAQTQALIQLPHTCSTITMNQLHHQLELLTFTDIDIEQELQGIEYCFYRDLAQLLQPLGLLPIELTDNIWRKMEQKTYTPDIGMFIEYCRDLKWLLDQQENAHKQENVHNQLAQSEFSNNICNTNSTGIIDNTTTITGIQNEENEHLLQLLSNDKTIQPLTTTTTNKLSSQDQTILNLHKSLALYTIQLLSLPSLATIYPPKVSRRKSRSRSRNSRLGSKNLGKSKRIGKSCNNDNADNADYGDKNTNICEEFMDKQKLHPNIHSIMNPDDNSTDNDINDIGDDDDDSNNSSDDESIRNNMNTLSALSTLNGINTLSSLSNLTNGNNNGSNSDYINSSDGVDSENAVNKNLQSSKSLQSLFTYLFQKPSDQDEELSKVDGIDANDGNDGNTINDGDNDMKYEVNVQLSTPYCPEIEYNPLTTTTLTTTMKKSQRKQTHTQRDEKSEKLERKNMMKNTMKSISNALSFVSLASMPLCNPHLWYLQRVFESTLLQKYIQTMKLKAKEAVEMEGRKNEIRQSKNSPNKRGSSNNRVNNIMNSISSLDTYDPIKHLRSSLGLPLRINCLESIAMIAIQAQTIVSSATKLSTSTSAQQRSLVSNIRGLTQLNKAFEQNK